VALKNELQIPAAAKSDAKSFELMRAWIADSDLHVSLQLGGWEEPAPWGVVLADLARHVANFYVDKMGMDREEVKAILREEFLEELASGSDEAEGEIDLSS
jgi:hypothetical protein